jgi:chemotaxis protein histidine kinase CheA
VGRFAGPPQPGQPTVPGQQPGETQAQAEARLRFKYKADGQEVEEELTQAEIAQRLARDRASYRRFEESAKRDKDVAAREQAFRQSLANPNQFRQVLFQEALRAGYSKADAAEYAHDFMARALAGHLDEAEMDPRDRELLEYKQREQERQRQEEEQQKTAKAEAFKAGVRAKYETWKQDIITAAKAAGEAGLPVDEEMIRVMGKHRTQSMRHGVECTTAELVDVAMKHADTYVMSRLKSAPYEVLAKRYPDIVKTIRLGLRDQARAARNPPPRAQNGGQPRVPEPPKKPSYSGSDFRSFQRLANGE